MMMKKKCEPYYMAHPLVCGAVAGLAVIGLVGVVMAVKKKAKCWGKTAKQFGCDCIDTIEKKTEDLIDKSMDAMRHMTDDCSC